MNSNKTWISIAAGVAAALLALSLPLGILTTSASAASSSEIKQQIQDLENQNDALQAQIDALKNQQNQNLSDINAMVSEKSVIEQQVGLLQAQVRNVNEQIATYAQLIADKQEELEASEEYLAELNEENRERIRAMEEDGKLSYWSVLLQANSFSDLLDRLNMVEEIAAAQLVAAAKADLQNQRVELQAVKADLAIKQQELNVKSGEAQVLLEKLIAKGEEYEQTMHDYEEELNKLEQSIADAEVKLDQALQKEAADAVANNGQYLGPGYSNNIGSAGGIGGTTKVDANGITWVVPCDYKNISSPFGERIHPVYGYKHTHTGVDLNADCLMRADGTTDSPIYAVRGGRVTIAQYSSTAGYYVTIDHGDGYRSTYMHMCCMPFVEVGQVVAAGQIIGCIGTTGTSTGDHLHFGIYYYNELQNPMNFIG